MRSDIVRGRGFPTLMQLAFRKSALDGLNAKIPAPDFRSGDLLVEVTLTTRSLSIQPIRHLDQERIGGMQPEKVPHVAAEGAVAFHAVEALTSLIPHQEQG